MGPAIAELIAGRDDKEVFIQIKTGLKIMLRQIMKIKIL